jgi:hypothetical protein
VLERALGLAQGKAHEVLIAWEVMRAHLGIVAWRNFSSPMMS